MEHQRVSPDPLNFSNSYKVARMKFNGIRDIKTGKSRIRKLHPGYLAHLEKMLTGQTIGVFVEVNFYISFGGFLSSRLGMFSGFPNFLPALERI
jgi:hypothetical protein